MADPVLIVLSGPPGAGKTTVARLVASRFERGVYLESDWFWTTLVHGYIPPWQVEADGQNRVIVRTYAAAAAVMAAGGFAVVLDGLVGPWMLDEVRSQTEPLDVELNYVVLRPPRAVALARAKGRAEEWTAPYAALTDTGPVLALWDQFADLGPYEDRVIDNGHLDPEAAADAVWTLVTGGRPPG